MSYASEEDCGPVMKRLWDGGTLLEGIIVTIALPSQDWIHRDPTSPAYIDVGEVCQWTYLSKHHSGSCLGINVGEVLSCAPPRLASLGEGQGVAPL